MSEPKVASTQTGYRAEMPADHPRGAGDVQMKSNRPKAGCVRFELTLCVCAQRAPSPPLPREDCNPRLGQVYGLFALGGDAEVEDTAPRVGLRTRRCFLIAPPFACSKRLHPAWTHGVGTRTALVFMMQTDIVPFTSGVRCKRFGLTTQKSW